MTCTACCCELCNLICSCILVAILVGIIGLSIYFSIIIFWALLTICFYYYQHLDACYIEFCEKKCKKIYNVCCKCKCNNRISAYDSNSDSDSDSDSDSEMNDHNDVENPSIKETKNQDIIDIIIIENPGPIPFSMGRKCN